MGLRLVSVSQSERGKPSPPTQFASNMSSQRGVMRVSLPVPKDSRTFQEELISSAFAFLSPTGGKSSFSIKLLCPGMPKQLCFSRVYAYIVMINRQCLAFKQTECSIGQSVISCSRKVFTEMFWRT